MPKTHCKHGHPLTPDNVYVWRNGRRSCKTCGRERTKEWAAKHPDRIRLSNAIGKTKIAAKALGVPLETVLSVRQRPCEICGSAGEPRHGKVQSHVDHNHRTNKLRGALCASCNLGLGKFKDSKELLFGAINYLRRYDSASA